MTTTPHRITSNRRQLVLLGIGIALAIISALIVVFVNAPGAADAGVSIDINPGDLVTIAVGVVIAGLVCAVLTSRTAAPSASRAITSLSLILNAASVGAMATLLPGLLRQ
jgi:hypothetical protein